MALKPLISISCVFILVALLQPNDSTAITNNFTCPDFICGYDVPVTLVESVVSTGAVCLDGTAPGYHFSQGFGDGTDKWLVYLVGGEWCHNVSDCHGRKSSHLGSANYFTPLKFSGIPHNISTKNPDFYSWNRVMVRYCDVASFTGDVETVDPTTGLYFRGKKILDVVIEDLSKKGLKEANQVLLAGGSAGGLAVIIHCDRFSDLFSSATKVKCLSDGGFFMHSKNHVQAQGLETMFRETVDLHNSTGVLPEACKQRMGDTPYLCFFPQYLLQDIKTPMLIMMTSYDSYQINKTLSTDFYE